MIGLKKCCDCRIYWIMISNTRKLIKKISWQCTVEFNTVTIKLVFFMLNIFSSQGSTGFGDKKRNPLKTLIEKKIYFHVIFHYFLFFFLIRKENIEKWCQKSNYPILITLARIVSRAAFFIINFRDNCYFLDVTREKMTCIFWS